MSKTDAKKIVKKYAEFLSVNNYPFKEIYLFGSYAKGRQHEWSDIDVAVVSDRLKGNILKKEIDLSRFSLKIDNRIEPHGFTVKDFSVNWDPLVHEIKTTGIKIA